MLLSFSYYRSCQDHQHYVSFLPTILLLLLLILQGERMLQESEDAISRLISMLRQTKMVEASSPQGDGGSMVSDKPTVRVLTVEELSELSYEKLLLMQDNLNQAIMDVRSKELKCAVCLDREKDAVCVPCGHRFCMEVSDIVRVSQQTKN